MGILLLLPYLPNNHPYPYLTTSSPLIHLTPTLPHSSPYPPTLTPLNSFHPSLPSPYTPTQHLKNPQHPPTLNISLTTPPLYPTTLPTIKYFPPSTTLSPQSSQKLPLKPTTTTPPSLTFIPFYFIPPTPLSIIHINSHPFTSLPHSYPSLPIIHNPSYILPIVSHPNIPPTSTSSLPPSSPPPTTSKPFSPPYYTKTPTLSLIPPYPITSLSNPNPSPFPIFLPPPPI